MSVLLYAAKEGAKEILETILHIPEVYFMNEGKTSVFDVTNLIPETHVENSTIVKSDKLKLSSSGDLKAETVSKRIAVSPTVIDLIVRNENLSLANDMMDILPMRHLVRDIWSAYQSIYVIIILIHLTYMFAFSIVCIPLMDSIPHADNSSSDQDQVHFFPNALFLIWPAIFLMYEIYFLIHSIYRWCLEVGKFTRSRDYRKYTPFYAFKRFVEILFGALILHDLIIPKKHFNP